MSYEIVKKIRIEDNRVFLSCDSNNVFPKDYTERENKYLTDMLQSEGMEEVNFNILEAYENGNFQKGIENKWSRAIGRLKLTEQYKAYNWHNSDYLENCPIQAARRTPKYKSLLLSSLTLKESPDKYIIRKTAGQCGYVLKVTKRYIKYTVEQAKAKIFRSMQEAERIGQYIQSYEIIKP